MPPRCGPASPGATIATRNEDGLYFRPDHGITAQSRGLKASRNRNTRFGLKYILDMTLTRRYDHVS